MLEIFCVSHPEAYRAINKHTQMVCLKEVNISTSFKRLGLVIKSISEIPKYPFYDVQVPNGKVGCSKNKLWSGGSVELQKWYYFTLSQLKHSNTLLYPAPLSRSLKWKASPEDWQKSIFSAWKNHYHTQFFNQQTWAAIPFCSSLPRLYQEPQYQINTVGLWQNSITGCPGEHNTSCSSQSRSMQGTKQMEVGS